ncbi:MAG: Fructose dehydrogenase large subunit [Acidimicrobiales bacterium]|nr:MAG: GMC family oxidoreductase [Actinomycetota bacterium]MBV6510246.1 Fructose dehydrogenase large subunit [Acidimicrobiales bacterium]RIK04211.1 MAG: GMC family oxidoreductase [Acidobacteriota bacterium]
MLLDAHDLATGDELRTDVCIIGAGAAGIAIAMDLAGSGHDVVVLESGGLDGLDPQTQDLYAGENVGHPMVMAEADMHLDTVRIRAFGGSTNHWSGLCRPLDPEDFEQRPWIPNSGWPIAFGDVEPYYPAAQGLLGLGPYDYDWRYWSDNYGLGEPLVDDDVVETVTYQMSEPIRMSQAYRDDLVDADNVRLVIWANVTNLDIAPESDLLDSVSVSTLDGTTFTVVATAYVLATGGIEVPRMLLASNDVRRAGLGNQHDLVGRYFMEHPHVMRGLVVLEGEVSAYLYYGHREISEQGIGPPLPPMATAHGAFAVTPEGRATHELLGAAFTVRTALPDAGSGTPAAPDVTELLDVEAGAPSAGRLQLWARGEQAPDPASRVTLSAERDALGIRRAQLDWRVSDQDIDSIHRSLVLVANRFGTHRKGRVQVEQDSQPVADWPVEIGGHHMGTTRMAEEPRRGVVDANCRVHDVANLYVAGSSVFTTSGYANPTLTIVALALRLSDHLRNQVL